MTVLDWCTDFPPHLFPAECVSVPLLLVDCVSNRLLLEECVFVVTVLVVVLTFEGRLSGFGEDSGLLSSQSLPAVLSVLLFDLVLDLKGLARLCNKILYHLYYQASNSFAQSTFSLREPLKQL